MKAHQTIRRGTAATIAAATLGAGFLAVAPASAATNVETHEMLTFAVQEEKMARDLYLELSDEYGVRQFANIARSEQMHMDAVRVLLDRYGIDDPTVGDPLGEFDNAEIQALYDELLAKGMSSLAKASKVGIAVEKLDIDDIDDMLADRPATDVSQVLRSLRSGSLHHLSAFRRLRDRVT